MNALGSIRDCSAAIGARSVGSHSRRSATCGIMAASSQDAHREDAAMLQPLLMPPRDAEEWGLPDGADDEAAD